MSLPVSLKAVVGELEVGGGLWYAYINRHTGELVSLPDEDSDVAEDFVEDFERVEASNDFIVLPSQLDIHEYRIMERFVEDHPDDRIGAALGRAINGRGAFRRFKDDAHRLGVIGDWYAYRDKAIARIAAEFLDETGIAFTDDVGLDGSKS